MIDCYLMFQTSPGEEAILDIVAKDELNNSMFTVISDKVVSSDGTMQPLWLRSPETFTTIGAQSTTVRFKYTYDYHFGMPINATANIFYYDLFTIGRVFANFTLIPEACRPGFVQQGDSCVCDKDQTGILG